MELVNVKIRRYPDLIKGIVIMRNTQWLVLAENVVDYVLDGFLFINHDYIQNVIVYPHDTIEYKVLSVKNSPDLIFPNIEGYSDLIEYLKGNSVLIAIGRHKQNSILVGYVADFNKEAFSLIPIGVDLQELPIVKINYKQIRYISVMSDYLTSISNYLSKK